MLVKPIQPAADQDKSSCLAALRHYPDVTLCAPHTVCETLIRTVQTGAVLHYECLSEHHIYAGKSDDKCTKGEKVMLLVSALFRR